MTKSFRVREQDLDAADRVDIGLSPADQVAVDALRTADRLLTAQGLRLRVTDGLVRVVRGDLPSVLAYVPLDIETLDEPLGPNGPINLYAGYAGATGMTGAPSRKCPECQLPYYNDHPESDCKYGTAERIMES